MSYPKCGTKVSSIQELDSLNHMLLRTDHVVWVVIQQVFVRGMNVIKFILAARFLGPDQIGLVGIAMLSLAIVESLSATGMSQAVIQSHRMVNRSEAGAIWTLQLSRGGLLAGLLFGLADPISLVFNLPASAGLIAIAAAMPFLRNAVNPGIFLVQRDRNFRKLAFYETSAALLDLAVTMLLIYLGFGPASILIGNISGDSLKVVVTWTWCKVPIDPNYKWRSIQSLTGFGKWVWGSSVFTLILNQIDKVLVAKFLGAQEFGLYQVASRIAQLAVADGAVALGQYLYPTFAERHRTSSQDARKYLTYIMQRLIPIAATIAVLLAMLSNSLVRLVLGTEWFSAVPVLQMMALPMFLGAVIAMLVSYLSGTGKPRIVTEATVIQLGVLVICLTCAPLLMGYFNAIAMVSALAIAGTASVAFMFVSIYKILND